MRRVLTILTLSALFGSLVFSNVSRAGCAPKGNACPPKPSACRPHPCVSKCFAKWDACRERFTQKMDKCFNPTCCQKGAIYAVPPCAVPAVTCCPQPGPAPSGQGG